MDFGHDVTNIKTEMNFARLAISPKVALRTVLLTEWTGEFHENNRMSESFSFTLNGVMSG